MATKTMIGIADCHGIESFLAKGTSDFPFVMRADCNRQRHAVYYEVDLDDAAVNRINSIIAKKDFIKALKVLKSLATVIRTPRHHACSWDLIPNPKLDPWG
jgi:hypothetical protein